MDPAAAARAVSQSWTWLNATLFRKALKPPVVRLADGSRLGSWHRATRTLTVGRELVDREPWPVVVEVIKHEMAHQYVDEVLGVHDEAPHGAAFARVCAQIGADPSPTGVPAATEEPAVVRKVRKLLALAESANHNEAELAANAAHRLMRKHNLEVLGEATSYHARVVGRVAQRHMAWEQLLGGLLGKHFFVHPIWVQAWLPDRDAWGRVLELNGRPENLDLAQHVHALVTEVGERAWRDHKRVRGSEGRDRGRFLAGVVMGFGERLAGEAQACEQTGLVWVGDPGLQDWVDRRFPRVRSGRGIRLGGGDAWQQGKATGRNLVLRKPLRSQGARGRLLEG